MVMPMMMKMMIFCGEVDEADDDEDDCFRCSYHVVIIWHCFCLCLVVVMLVMIICGDDNLWLCWWR